MLFSDRASKLPLAAEIKSACRSNSTTAFSMIGPQMPSKAAKYSRSALKIL
jgi:hypothetical protein